LVAKLDSDNDELHRAHGVCYPDMPSNKIPYPDVWIVVRIIV